MPDTNKHTWTTTEMAEEIVNRSTAPPGSASPRFVSEDRRNHAFRSLVSDIAERLDTSNIESIIWHQELPSSLQNKTALEVMEYLYKHGLYTEYEVRPLAQLLKDIHREDLINRVDTFWKQFGKPCPTRQSNCTLLIILVSTAGSFYASIIIGTYFNNISWS